MYNYVIGFEKQNYTLQFQHPLQMCCFVRERNLDGTAM